MNKTKLKIIVRLVAGHIADFFPFYLVVYVLIFLLSFISKLWQTIWLQPMLHISLIVLGIIYWLVKKNRIDIVGKRVINIKQFSVDRFGAIQTGIKKKGMTQRTLKHLWSKVKDGVMGRVTASIALFFLALCPFLLIFKKDAIAEKSAIYAYYFLVITVVLMIIENFLNKSVKSESL